MWLLIPALIVAGMVGVVISGYEPLMFDPSLVQEAQAAQASTVASLKQRDAKEESSKSSASVALGGGTPAPAEAVQTAAAPSVDGLADGTWTGYAACGQGNGDGWKPYYVAVTIEVKNGKVTGITDVQGTSQSDSGGALSWDPGENQSYLTWAASGRNGAAGVVSQMNSALGSGSSPSGIDAVSGATYSSAAIYNAYVAAVNKAARANGATSTNAPATASKASSDSSKKSSSNSGKKKTKKVSDSTSSSVKNKSLADGTWVGYAACGEGNEEEWSPYYVVMTVTVKNGKVTGISKVTGSSKGDTGAKSLKWNESENKAYLDWAAAGRTRGGVKYVGVVPQITTALEAGSYPASIDAVSGATYSSESLLKAFYAALKKSADAGGVTITEPTKPEKSQSAASPDPSQGASSPDSSTGSEDPASGNSPDPEDPSGSEESPDPNDPSQGDDGQTPTLYVDGAYSGYAFCKDLDEPKTYSPYYIIVEVEVVDGKIARISDVFADSEGVVDPSYKYDSSENSTYLTFAIQGVGKRVKGMVAKMQEKIDAGEDATRVDVVSSATWSSKSIVEAYGNAVSGIPLREEEGASE